MKTEGGQQAAPGAFAGEPVNEHIEVKRIRSPRWSGRRRSTNAKGMDPG